MNTWLQVLRLQALSAHALAARKAMNRQAISLAADGKWSIVTGLESFLTGASSKFRIPHDFWPTLSIGHTLKRDSKERLGSFIGSLY